MILSSRILQIEGNFLNDLLSFDEVVSSDTIKTFSPLFSILIPYCNILQSADSRYWFLRFSNSTSLKVFFTEPLIN